MNTQQFIAEFTRWAEVQDEILGVLLVGSYARNSAKPDSDIDLVIITNKPEIYLNDDRWIKNFGVVKEIRDEDYKLVQARRVFYENGLEVEYGITTKEWAKTDPIDEGTERVIKDGAKILADKSAILNKLVNKVIVYQSLAEVCGFLNKENIEYLVYGSAAYLLYGDEEASVHDIDLIVKEKDFETITSFIKNLNFNPIKTPFSIHANSTNYKGLDDKPFDVSFDSYEYYFQKHNINLSNFENIKVKDVEIKVIKKDYLKKIYMIGVKQGYEKAAENYLSQRDQFQNEKYLEKLIKLLNPKATILDIGCGAGIPIDKYLIDKGFKVIGIDFSEKQIELAKQNIPQGQFEVKDMMKLKDNEYKVDAVVSFYAIFHTPRETHQELFRKINSFLPKGGYFLGTMGSSDWEGSEEFHGVKMWWSHYNAEKSIEIIKNAGFEIVFEEIDSTKGERHLVVLARKI